MLLLIWQSLLSRVARSIKFLIKTYLGCFLCSSGEIERGKLFFLLKVNPRWNMKGAKRRALSGIIYEMFFRDRRCDAMTAEWGGGGGVDDESRNENLCTCGWGEYFNGMWVALIFGKESNGKNSRIAAFCDDIVNESPGATLKSWQIIFILFTYWSCLH